MTRRDPRRRNPDATKFALDQRSTANEFATTVWNMVRNRGVCGEKFRREYTIQPYTVDFCCVSLKLVVEVDGEHHFTEEGIERDRKRDAFLRALGYEVLRIPGYAVLRDPGQVRDQIVAAIKQRRDG